jgi:putative hydrolase of the HAD superfamily
MGSIEPSLTQGSKASFFSFFQMNMITYEDTLPMLQTLRAKGVKVGVLTDVPYGMDREYAEHDLRSIAEYIDVFITSAEVGYRKPDSHGYLELARRLDAQPDRMVFVGNEEKDIVGANNAGMFSILLDREQKNHSYGEQWRISSLAELQALFA